MYIFADAQLDHAVDQSRDLIRRFSETYFSGRSVLTFIIAMALAIIVGRIFAAVMRRFARMLSNRADKTPDLNKVNRLRRIETLTILGVALVRLMLFIFALYFWWNFAHPHQQPTALIGASALAAIIAGATVAPILRDLAYGGVMMAEHWFGVGDHIKVEPFSDLQGVVERVTLRSTKIRGLNGEVIWISNQNIQGVRVAPKGVRTIAIDLFVSDLERGLKLIEQTNLRLPTSSLTVVRPLHIMSENQLAPKLWHVVAIGETAPGREWMLEDYALRILRELNEEEKHPVFENDPIARYADIDAERRFARTIQNARKSSLQRRALPTPEDIVEQLGKRLYRKGSPKSAGETDGQTKKHP